MRQTMRFEGSDCVVTGGTGALGQAVVGALLDAGARVHVPWIAEREVAAFRHRDRVTMSKVDLADERAIGEFYRGLPGLFASIHVAGGFAMSTVLETSAADFEAMWRLNTLTAFLASREAIRAIRRTRPARGGRIVNVAARPVVQPVGGMVAYSTSKAGVAALTQALAAETVDDGILVNAVLPSIMDTPANRAAMPGADHAAWPKVTEVAEAIVFLASPANAVTSGALVPVYGRA